MKKLQLLALLLTTITTLHAQLRKGTHTFGGGVGVQQELRLQNGASNPAFLNFTPSFATFISDHWLVGLSTNLGVNLWGGSNRFSGFLTPKVRYYLNPDQGKYHFYGDVSSAFGLSENTLDAWRFSVGANRFLNKNIALEASLDYSVIEDSFGENPLALSLSFRPFLSRQDRQEKSEEDLTFQKGDWQLPRSLLYTWYQYDRLTFTITPSAGYFLNANWMIGLNTWTNFAIRTNDNPFPVPTLRLAATPFVRYYFSPKNQGQWFSEASVNFDYSRREFESAISKTFDSSVGLKHGYAWFLTPNLSLECFFSVTYNFDRWFVLDNQQEVSPPFFVEDFRDYLDINNLQLRLGTTFQYYLRPVK